VRLMRHTPTGWSLITRSLRYSGNPCLHSHSTMSSLVHSSRQPNWQSLHCNRTEPTWCRAKSRSRCPGWGSPFRGPCSTKPSCRLTSRPANSRNRRRNCKDRRGLEAVLADRKCDGDCSTTTSCWATRMPTCPQRSWDRLGPAAGSVAAALAEASVEASEGASVAVWERRWQAAWWGTQHQQWRSNTPAAPLTRSL